MLAIRYPFRIVSDAPSSATTTPLPGQVLLGRYRLESLVRRGGMGSVWRAEHLQLKSPVAIKLLKPEIAQDPVMVQRFMREAQAAAALRSPNVVQILDHGIDAGRPFIAMEMLEGEPLSERIARLGRLAPDELFPLFGRRAARHDQGARSRHRAPRPQTRQRLHL